MDYSYPVLFIIEGDSGSPNYISTGNAEFFFHDGNGLELAAKNKYTEKERDPTK
jgi:hypothetical protein